MEGKVRFAQVLRSARGLHLQAEIGRQIGHDQKAISLWESGRTLPSATHWPQLATAMRLPVADLICLLAWERSSASGGTAEAEAQAAGRRLLALIERRHADEHAKAAAEHAQAAAELTETTANPEA